MTVASQVRTRCPHDLLTAIRGVTARQTDWAQTAALVGRQLRGHLPGAEILTPAERAGSPDGYCCHTLHAEPDGSFSICALVWRPGQVTAIHDHVAWCVFGVLQGVEFEELYALGPGEQYLEKTGEAINPAGEVGGFAPPGDIHRVRNFTDDIAISLHVYGTDISRLGSSVRRVYELPLLGSAR